MKLSSFKVMKSMLALALTFGMIAPNVLAQEKGSQSTGQAGFRSVVSGFAPVSISLATAFTVSPPQFTNAQGSPIVALTANGFMKTQVSVKNETGDARQAALIVALFNSAGSMENVAYVEKMVAAGATEGMNAGFALPAIVDGKYVKVFVWDSFQGMQPLSNAYRFPVLDESYANVALGKPYTITPGFQDKDLMAYETRTASDNGSAYELTDGNIATSKQYNDSCGCDMLFPDKNWIGFNRQVNRSVVIDLEQPKYIDSIVGGFLQERVAAVDLPRYVKYSLSNDGTSWYSAGRQNPAYSNTQLSSRVEIVKDIHAVARYVKIEFEVGMFTFADEIKVMGRDTKASDTPASALPPEIAPADAVPPTLSEAGGVKHMYIAYYYPVGSDNEQLGRWTQIDFKSVIAHTDQQNNRTGWMFDTILFSNGGDVYEDYNTKEKWQTYLNQLFTDGLHIGALDEATAEAKIALGNPGYKTKVVISVPYPNPDADVVWGELNGTPVDFNIGNGETASFQARKKAAEWYVQTAVDMFNAKQYENVELAGFYWQHEEVGFRTAQEETLLKQIAEKIHAAGKKFYWIPFFQANGSTIWKELGFDVVMMQPNYYFNSNFGPNEKTGKADLSRLKATVDTAKRFGMGVEVEGDYQMAWQGWNKDWDGQLYNADYAKRKYYAYLNEYKKTNLDRVTTGYYLGARTVLPDIMTSARSAYDETSKFIDGTYADKPLDETEIPIPRGTSYAEAIELTTSEGQAYDSAALNEGLAEDGAKWFKFAISPGDEWEITLTPMKGTGGASNAEVAMETRWSEGPALKYTYSWQSRETEPQKLTMKNEEGTVKFAYIRTLARDAGGNYTISLRKLTPGQQPIRGTSYAEAIELMTAEGQVYDSAAMNEGLAEDGAKWFKFAINAGDEWEITLTPVKGTGGSPNAEVAMETRWVEGSALKYTYSWQSRETEPQKLTMKNEEGTVKFAYIRTLSQQTGGHYTISLQKLIPTP